MEKSSSDSPAMIVKQDGGKPLAFSTCLSLEGEDSNPNVEDKDKRSDDEKEGNYRNHGRKVKGPSGCSECNYNKKWDRDEEDNDDGCHDGLTPGDKNIVVKKKE